VALRDDINIQASLQFGREREEEKSQGARKSIEGHILNFYFLCFQFMFSTLIMEFIFINMSG
jgi:hypothetical protein